MCEYQIYQITCVTISSYTSVIIVLLLHDHVSTLGGCLSVLDQSKTASQFTKPIPKTLIYSQFFKIQTKYFRNVFIIFYVISKNSVLKLKLHWFFLFFI